MKLPRPAGSTHTTRKVTECAASVPDASLSGRSAAAEVTPRGLGRTFHPGLAPVFGCVALLNFVAARVEPGSQSRRDSAESYESSGGLHPSRMEHLYGNFLASGSA
jgi:hypothetical protein